MTVAEGGTMRDVIDSKLPANAPGPMRSTPSSIVSCAMSHDANALAWTSFTEPGIVSDDHLWALLPTNASVWMVMLPAPSSMIRPVSWHMANAFTPIDVTVDGIMTSVPWIDCRKAAAPMLDTPGSMIRLVM